MGESEVFMATEVLGFNDKEMRDDQYRRWKAEGSFGLARYSTHQGNDPQIIYVVTRADPAVSCLQINESIEIFLKMAKEADERRSHENDGQDSVHDDLGGGGGEPTPVHESGNPAEGDTKGPDSDFRDWSA